MVGGDDVIEYCYYYDYYHQHRSQHDIYYPVAFGYEGVNGDGLTSYSSCFHLQLGHAIVSVVRHEVMGLVAVAGIVVVAVVAVWVVR